MSVAITYPASITTHLQSENVSQHVPTISIEDYVTGTQELLFAAQEGAVNTMQTLLQSGISPNATTADKLSALHFTAFHHHLPALEFLLEKGANINAQDLQKQTPLHLSLLPKDRQLPLHQRHLQVIEIGDESVALCLLDNGAKHNIANLEGTTALHLAAKNGFINVIKKMASTHTLITNLQDKNHQTPIDLAQAAIKQQRLFLAEPEGYELTEAQLEKVKNNIRNFEEITHLLTLQKPASTLSGETKIAHTIDGNPKKSHQVYQR